MRRFTPVELAIGFCLTGTVLAVAIPTFARELHASRLVEPEDGLARLGAATVAYAEGHGRLPDPAPLTPAVPPRGAKAADPPGAWDVPAWKALDFRPVAEGVPHAFAFQLDVTGDRFVGRARGDLDGDGVTSLFEIRGDRTSLRTAVEPGMYVENELE